jgi:hypothetical protein
MHLSLSRPPPPPRPSPLPNYTNLIRHKIEIEIRELSEIGMEPKERRGNVGKAAL